MTHKFLLVSVFSFLLGQPLVASHGAPQKQAAVTATVVDIDPRALTMWERVQVRMASIRSLSVSSRETITHIGTAAIPEKRSLIKTTRLRLMRPNLTRAEIVWLGRPATSALSQDRVIETLAADGRTTWRLWDRTNELTVWPTDPSGEDAEKDLPGPLRGFFDKNLLPMAFLAALENQHLVRRLRYLGEQSRKGTPYQVIRFEYQKAGTSVVETDDYFIGRDLMIHRLTCAWGDTQVQADLADLKIDFPMARISFAYMPPASAKVQIPVPSQRDMGAALGTPAPDFTLKAADGRMVHLADLRGKVVVLDFWATWCGNCVQEFPGENALAEKYADQGVVVLAVDVCDAEDVYQRWLAKHPHYKELLFALDPKGISGKGINTVLYKESSLPAQYVIDRNGLFAGAISGYNGDTKEATLEAAIKKACGL